MTEKLNTEIRIKDDLREILKYIGEDPDREGLQATPDRMVRSWKELFSGYDKDPKDILTVFDAENHDQMVLLKNIEIYSMCEHHFLPFVGECHIAYIPRDKIVGISKLARIAEIYARRLQVQERLTDQIANCIVETIDPLGVGVVIEAQHLCMKSRGVEKQHSVMVTSALRGCFKDESGVREEFLGLIK
jgi:GTP cyclohydrolase I